VTRREVSPAGGPLSPSAAPEPYRPSGSDVEPALRRFFGTPITEFRGLERSVELAHCESATTGSIVPSSPATFRPVAIAFRTAACETPRRLKRHNGR